MDEKKSFLEDEIIVSIADAVKELEVEMKSAEETETKTETKMEAVTESVIEKETEMEVIPVALSPEPEVPTVETKKAEVFPAQSNDTPGVRRKKKAGAFGRRIAAVALAAVLGGGSLGIGLSVGGGIAGKYFGGTVTVEGQAEALITREPFSFAESPTQASVIPLIAQAYAANVSIPDIVEAVADSVVSINVTTTVTMFNQQMNVPGAGSGIIFMEDSERIYIATNNHVIEGAKNVTISVDDEIQINANLVGTNPEADIAVISVTKADMLKAGVTYTTARMGDSSNLRVGEPVIAIGNALGEGKTATMGIISAKNKQITVDRNKTLDVIQTDAAINSGNSGGALVNMNGEVIGINTAKLSGTGIEGMGYSIPISEARNIMDNLLAAGPADQQPYLGIQGFDFTEEMQQMYNVSVVGVYVQSVVTNGTAYSMGLRARDVIVGMNGEEIKNWEALVEELGKTSVGETVKIDVYRNGVTPMSFEGKMMSDPNQTNF